MVCNFGEKDYVYFNQSNDLLRATWSKLGKTAPTRYFEDPRTRALDHETFQISPFVGPELEAELVGLCSNVRGVRWHPDFTDLIPADGGKPRGIQRFMAHYGITHRIYDPLDPDDQQFALFCPAVTGLMDKQRARDESRALWC